MTFRVRIEEQPKATWGQDIVTCAAVARGAGAQAIDEGNGWWTFRDPRVVPATLRVHYRGRGPACSQVHRWVRKAVIAANESGDDDSTIAERAADAEDARGIVEALARKEQEKARAARLQREAEERGRQEAAREAAEAERLRLERERQASVPAKRDDAKPAAAPSREGPMSSAFPGTRDEKRRLVGIILRERERLRMSNGDLADLLGVHVSTIEKWRGGLLEKVGFAEERLREWGETLCGIESPKVGAPPPAPSKPAADPVLSVKALQPKEPPEVTVRAAFANGAGNLVLRATIPAAEHSVVVDIKALSDVDLLGLQHAIGSEMLRRAGAKGL